MTLDIAEVRDAIMEAQAFTQKAILETVDQFTFPDKLLGLAVQTAIMPDEAWKLIDQETKDAIVEVLSG